MSEPSPLLPKDKYSQQLEANVHPNNWTNPTPEGRYNLVVIGAGTAGLVTAAGAAGLGAKVALVERAPRLDDAEADDKRRGKRDAEEDDQRRGKDPAGSRRARHALACRVRVVAGRALVAEVPLVPGVARHVAAGTRRVAEAALERRVADAVEPRLRLGRLEAKLANAAVGARLAHGHAVGVIRRGVRPGLADANTDRRVGHLDALEDDERDVARGAPAGPPQARLDGRPPLAAQGRHQQHRLISPFLDDGIGPLRNRDTCGLDVRLGDISLAVLSHIAQDETGSRLKALAGRGGGNSGSTSSPLVRRRSSLGIGAHIVTAPTSASNAPRIVKAYASYLDDRVRAYRELRHDVIRSSDSSRNGGGATSNRLRRLNVEKGLLREVGITQKVGNAILNCDVSNFE